MTATAEKSREKLRKLYRRMLGCPPRNKRELAAWLRAFFGLRIPARPMCPAHDSPLDYLSCSFFGTRHLQPGNTASDPAGDNTNRDLLVWANRGGGKTHLGAVATLLEGLFRPRCQVRILSGSEEQARRMYEYIQVMLQGQLALDLPAHTTARETVFPNGTRVQVLTQSQRSIRGHHVQRLRCDEVELFDRRIWQGAQFITQSSAGIAARLEAFSTMHLPAGLMHDLLQNAAENGMQVFRWCLWEVIEKCRDRVCSRCPLWPDCRGRARHAEGYYPVDDAVAQKRRSSTLAWKSEMLCLQPQLEDLVFPEFNPARHVRPVDYNGDFPLYRSMDFGFRNPLACLFIQVDNAGRVLVIDEHLKSRTTLAEHARLIKQRYPFPVQATYGDPAGKQRNEITGTAVVHELAALGIPLQYRPSRIRDGVELIRRYLDPAEGEPQLLVSPRCENLIRAFQALRFARLAGGALSELPEKDGVHDHVIDALRYFFINRFSGSDKIRVKIY